MLQFFDESAAAAVPANNPLPAGIIVSVTNAEGVVIGSAYTQAGGFCNITATADTPYTASFYGTRAPGQPQNFIGASGTTPVTVLGYRSPSLSTAGRQQAQADVFPLERVDPAELLPGGILYDLQMGNGAILAALDAQIQVALGAERLDSSSGLAIDSFANDFIGPGVWSRAPAETDAAYIARIKLWLTAPFGTLYAVQILMTAYLAAYVNPAILAGPVALNTSGALDISGGLDGATNLYPQADVPAILVFDWQSNPKLAAQVGLVQENADFCILYVYANATTPASFYLGQAYLGDTTFLGSETYYVAQPLDSAINDLVNRVKLAGSNPRYFSNSAAP